MGFTPWPTATAGVHPRIHSRSHFPYLTPCLYLSPHFTLVSLHLCVCLIFRRCYIKHLSPVTPVQQFACRFCRLISAKVINYYIVQPFLSGGGKVCFSFCALRAVQINTTLLMMWKLVLINKRIKHTFVFRNDYGSCLLRIALIVFATLDTCSLLMRM